MSMRLPHHVASVAAARQRIRDAMTVRQVGRGLAEDVALVISELVSNSVRHASPLPQGELEVAWDVGENIVELRVTDGGGEHAPMPRAPGSGEVSGRGLTIVATLAAAWGVEATSATTTVWALVRDNARISASPGRFRLAQ